MATRNCNGPSAFRSLRNSLKNSKWCAFRRTSAKLLKTWRQKLGERKGWWPWIQLQLGNGECISQAVGPVAMCEEQGEWIGYSAYFLGDKLKLSYIHPKAGPIIWQLQWKRRSILKRIIFFKKTLKIHFLHYRFKTTPTANRFSEAQQWAISYWSIFLHFLC